MKKMFPFLFAFSLFVLLTVLTQIGGFIYLLNILITKSWKSKIRKTLSFICLYLIISQLLVPYIAPFFGREKIKHSIKIQPTNYMSVLLNRNYVNPQLNDVLKETELELKNSPVVINYLDANFPFINGFPLIPHLSHNDGKKLDISLIYEDTSGKISPFQKSFSGYGVFVDPKASEFNQIEKCKNDGFFQYDLAKYLKFIEINNDLVFSNKGTKTLINSLLSNKQLGKIFIEPHLKSRLHLKHSKIRYHGCHAVRHDDHIHIQLK